MLSNQRDVSIIIPVCNEENNVEKLYEEIRVALPPERFLYEVIFVDDGSTDNTRHYLNALSKRRDNLRLVAHAKNFGQSAAIITGAKYARYSMLVTMDGDGQNDPQDIPSLFDHLKDDQTVILGLRKKRKDNFLRILSSRIGNAVRQKLLKDDCPDTGCSLKLFPRQAFLDLPHFNHLHRFLPALFKRARLQVVYVPVSHRPRWDGKSKYGVMNRLFVGLYDLVGVRWLLKRPCMPEISKEFNNEC